MSFALTGSTHLLGDLTVVVRPGLIRIMEHEFGPGAEGHVNGWNTKMKTNVASASCDLACTEESRETLMTKASRSIV